MSAPVTQAEFIAEVEARLKEGGNDAMENEEP